MVVEGKQIRGEQVILRPYEAGFTEEELRQMYQWSRDEDVLRWSGGSPLMMSFEDFEEAFGYELRRQDGHRRIFGLLTEAGELIGRLGYFNIDRRRGEAELGIVIGEKEYWGQGYGTDAIDTLLAHIFHETDLERVYLHTYAENERARRAFEKCGFREVRQHRKFSLERGSHDEVQMEVHRDDWIAARQGRKVNGLIKGDHR